MTPHNADVPGDTRCAVEGCPDAASLTADESLKDYCDEHVREWLMAEASIGRREVAA